MRNPFRPSAFAREGARRTPRARLVGWWWAAYGPAVGQFITGHAWTRRGADSKGAAAIATFREDLLGKDLV